MRWPRTLSLYVTREVVAYTSIGLAAVAIVMVSRERGDVYIDSRESDSDSDRYQRIGFDRLEYGIDVAHLVNPTGLALLARARRSS